VLENRKRRRCDIKVAWYGAKWNATGEHEIKEPQDESQKRVLQSSGDVVFQKQKPLMIFIISQLHFTLM
jgi:hypothetical protein